MDKEFQTPIVTKNRVSHKRGIAKTECHKERVPTKQECHKERVPQGHKARVSQISKYFTVIAKSFHLTLCS